VTWTVAWRPLAERDLIECAAHIAQDNTDAALRFIDAVEETVASLAGSPMLSQSAVDKTEKPCCQRTVQADRVYDSMDFDQHLQDPP
jgi:plasmid stabilization system protein ParE